VVELTDNVVVTVIKASPDRHLVLKVAKDLTRETMMIKRLHNEHIAQVIDSGEFIGVHWLLMDYCELGDLQQLLQSKGRFHEDVVSSLGWQLMKATGACHSANIAHLDIKLENCFLTQKGVLQLGDFGHACPNSRSLVISAGTKEYQAPEIMRRDAYDGFAADVFSIGVCLFTMLFGRRPWQRAHEDVPHYRCFLKQRDQFWANCADVDVSDWALEVVEDMLEPVPEMRYSLNELRKRPWFRHQLNTEEIAEYFA
jgi:serine/threonine protein kinase